MSSCATRHAPPPGPPPVEDLYKTALGDYMAAKYALAATEFDDVVKFYPDNALCRKRPLLPSARSTTAAASTPTPSRTTISVIEQYPDNNKIPASHLHKGEALIAMNQTDAGVRELRSLIQRFPNRLRRRPATDSTAWASPPPYAASGRKASPHPGSLIRPGPVNFRLFSYESQPSTRRSRALVAGQRQSRQPRPSAEVPVRSQPYLIPASPSSSSTRCAAFALAPASPPPGTIAVLPRRQHLIAGLRSARPNAGTGPPRPPQCRQHPAVRPARPGSPPSSSASQ